MNKTVTDHSEKKSNRILIFLLPVLTVYVIWATYMTVTGGWKLFYEYFYMTITMIFGSFVAGASSEGGGAVAFPVMTLIFKIEPKVARDFSLAIQSIGMTSATLWIIAKRIKIDKKYLTLVFIGSVFGILLGTYYIAPYTTPAYSKMLFVSFWLSFGVVLYIFNRRTDRDVREKLPDTTLAQNLELVFVGVIGGILSGVLGNGVDICSFSFVVMKYRLSEKVGTPTSVILMASNAVIGFVLHRFVINDVSPVVYNYWLVCIPVVMLGAPFGSYVASKLNRLFIANFLCFIILAQFIGAILIIRPTGTLLYFSLACFTLGVILFFLLTRNSKTKIER